MKNLQHKILSTLHKSNGMFYIDLINSFAPNYSDARLSLIELKKQKLVSFSSHEETLSFVKITPEGFCRLLDNSTDETTNNFESNSDTNAIDNKSNVTNRSLNFVKSIFKLIISAGALFTAITTLKPYITMLIEFLF